MSAALVEVTQADAATLESLRAGLQPFAHKSLGSLRIGMDEVRAVLSAISTIQSLTTRIAELEAENGRLRDQNAYLEGKCEGHHATLTETSHALQAAVDALEAIKSRDWTENCLDPQWAAERATAALATLTETSHDR